MRHGRKIVMAAMVIGGLVGGLAARFVGEFSPIAGAGVGAMTIAGLIIFAVLDWRNHDEAAQVAHKSAWFWGASVGAAASLGLLILWRGFEAAGYGMTPVAPEMLGYIWVGALGTILCQLTFYVAAWAGWWATKR